MYTRPIKTIQWQNIACDPGGPAPNQNTNIKSVYQDIKISFTGATAFTTVPRPGRMK